MDDELISRDKVIPILIEACPSFQACWEEHCKDYGEELLYVALGDFARHLLDLDRQHQDQVFPVVADAIERLHIEGDSYVKEATTIGLLEGIQNLWANNGADPQLFARYLRPISKKWWQSLEDFWSGKSKYVGEGL